jgi:UDP-N-acetylmuramyl tripeptide synthase
MFKQTTAPKPRGQLAHNFYDQPSQKIKLVGVTGTNGKTTIATLLYKLFTCLGYKCGLISTVENIIARENYSVHAYHSGCHQPECLIESNGWRKDALSLLWK